MYVRKTFISSFGAFSISETTKYGSWLEIKNWFVFSSAILSARNFVYCGNVCASGSSKLMTEFLLLIKAAR